MHCMLRAAVDRVYVGALMGAQGSCTVLTGAALR